MARYSVGVCAWICVDLCAKGGGKSSALLERERSDQPDQLLSHSQ